MFYAVEISMFKVFKNIKIVLFVTIIVAILLKNTTILIF
jgi:hypothetical protein